MPHAPLLPPDPPPLPERYVLEVWPQQPGRPWRALLHDCAGGARTEFDHPLALLRFVARHPFSDRRGGLR